MDVNEHEKDEIEHLEHSFELLAAVHVHDNAIDSGNSNQLKHTKPLQHNAIIFIKQIIKRHCRQDINDKHGTKHILLRYELTVHDFFSGNWIDV